MAAYTYIAIVVGFFALAFGFGFIAGVAHERDAHWVRPILTEMEIKQKAALANRDAQRDADELARLLDYDNSVFSVPERDRRKYLHGDFVEYIDITVAIWSVRVVEETLMEDDFCFESSFDARENKHRIKLPKESLALLDSIGVKYELITEKE